MSVVATVEMGEIRDTDALAAALRELGYEVTTHSAAVPIRQVYGSNARAHVVVSKESMVGPSLGDMGFVRNPDGTFDLIIDEMDLERQQERLSRLKALYNKHRIVNFALRNRMRVQSTVDSSGRIRIVLRTKS